MSRVRIKVPDVMKITNKELRLSESKSDLKTAAEVRFMGAATGLVIIDFVLRPLLRFSFKFYFIGFIILFLVYGFIAYKTLKSAYLSDN
jgi:predicted membrane-bound spermidine synthase